AVEGERAAALANDLRGPHALVWFLTSTWSRMPCPRNLAMGRRRLPRRGGGDIDDVPRDRLITTQTIRGPMPMRGGKPPDGRGIEAERQRACPRVVGVHDRNAVRMLPLDAGEVLLAVQPQEFQQLVIR